MIDTGMYTKTVFITGNSAWPVLKPIIHDVLHEENELTFAMTHFDCIDNSGCMDELDGFLELFDEMEVMANLNMKDLEYLSFGVFISKRAWNSTILVTLSLNARRVRLSFRPFSRVKQMRMPPSTL